MVTQKHTRGSLKIECSELQMSHVARATSCAPWCMTFCRTGWVQGLSEVHFSVLGAAALYSQWVSQGSSQLIFFPHCSFFFILLQGHMTSWFHPQPAWWWGKWWKVEQDCLNWNSLCSRRGNAAVSSPTGRMGYKKTHHMIAVYVVSTAALWLAEVLRVHPLGDCKVLLQSQVA